LSAECHSPVAIKVPSETDIMTNSPRRIVRVRHANVPEPPDGRFSNCLVVDGVAYIAGQTSREGDDVYAQSKIIFGKIKRLIEAAGGTMADVVKITTYVTDINQRDGVHKARQEHFTGDFPTATMIGVVALADPAYKVEVEAIAHIGAGGA
jgi:enamine deaminase RidA (YjgF/YER057c/UK114 family)